jgi:hypothetical protein
MRPAFQANPPPIPDLTVDWGAFNVVNQRTESLPWYAQDNDENGTFSRTEYFDLLVSFYGPNCTAYAGVLRDGLQVTQNLEQLFAAGMAHNGTEDIIYMPELVNDRYYERADITVKMNRDVSRTYDILTLLGADVSIDFENNYEQNFEVTQ